MAKKPLLKKIALGILGAIALIWAVFSLVMNMDRMVGGDLERGLANLKAIVEKPVAEAEPQGRAAPGN